MITLLKIEIHRFNKEIEKKDSEHKVDAVRRSRPLFFAYLKLIDTYLVMNREQEAVDAYEKCQELGFELVVVLGHPAYYPKFGFRRASEYGLANEVQADEAFMAIELLPGVLTKTNGLVKYAPEFNELDF